MCRAPLIIVSLYLPSEAKTLAPIDVKRDQRRLPSFCQKYQRNFGGGIGRTQCKCKVNSNPELMLRGTEITDTTSMVAICNGLNLATSNQDFNNDDKSNDNADECMACSACILENARNTTTPSPSITSCLNETEMRFNYNKYHMDAYGNLNQNLELPSDDVADESDDSPEVSLNQHSRPCTPDASRIIRITLNNKSNTADDEYRHRSRNTNYCNDDKPNSTSCR